MAQRKKASSASSPRKSTRAPVKKAPARSPRSAVEEPPPESSTTLPFEIDPKRIEESIEALKVQVLRWAKKGRYTKVRIKFRGKQVVPDLPLAAVAAFEGATFYWGGLLRALVFNLAGRAVIDVELVNDSEKKVARGKELLLSGDLDEALAAFREAEDMDAGNATVHLNIGIALKLRGDKAQARLELEKAKKLDKSGVIAAEADRLLASMPPPSVGIP